MSARSTAARAGAGQRPVAALENEPLSRHGASGWAWPRFAAHRGAGKCAPENTLAAMRHGFGLGYRMVEFDVKLSADGVAFLLHDDTLDRTTSGSGRADSLGWGELARLDAGAWHSPQYAGEPLPTLAAIARWAIAHGVACNVEIKPTPGRERETGAAVALDARGLWQGAPLQPILSSFSTEALEAARDAAPELARAHLFDELPGDWPRRLDALDCIALDSCYRALSGDIVARAHRDGRAVMTYTPNDPAIVARLIEWGVDCVITDAVDVVVPR
jgi:glycerophosphoryl diester phosphodiesterase